MRLHYLSMDPLTEGVGASQVTPYVTRLGRAGIDVVLHSFETSRPDDELRRALTQAGVTWRPLPFGAGGPRGGAGRVLRAAAAVRGAPLLHARGDVAAAAALVARPRRWVWDMRSFWREQRMELGMLRPGSPEERVFRRVERSAARRADAIITLAATAIPVLATRHGSSVSQKCTVITTCVDLDRFRPSAVPGGPVRFMLSGTLNQYYDVPAMTRLVGRAQARGEAVLHVLSPDASQWEAELREVRADVSSARPRDMPEHVAASTVGLSVCRPGLGVSLTAAMPTKIGEFLASGRPVVVSPGIGDLDDLLSRYDCGVVLASGGEPDLDASLDELDRLLADPALASRCRHLAEDHFNLAGAVTNVVSIYEELTG